MHYDPLLIRVHANRSTFPDQIRPTLETEENRLIPLNIGILSKHIIINSAADRRWSNRRRPRLITLGGGEGAEGGVTKRAGGKQI